VQAGADYLGFIFYPKSPRYVTPEMAGQIVAELRRRGHTPPCVGVFVNDPQERIHKVMAAAGLDLAQLHGDEPPEALASFSGAAYKAIRPKTRAEAGALAARYAPSVQPCGPGLLVDAYSPDAYGGTGRRADWALASELVAVYPRLLLAGGLNVENVGEAVVSVAPWGVDVASGVEATPGRKDHEAVRAFIANVRTASLD
jgi:phosphoribosylanthranilate isomerase